MDDVIIRKDRDTVFSEITRRAAALVLAGTLVDAVVVYAGHLYAPSKLSHSLLPIIVGVALLLIWILAVLILMRKAAKSWDRVFGAASGAPGASAEALEARRSLLAGPAPIPGDRGARAPCTAASRRPVPNQVRCRPQRPNPAPAPPGPPAASLCHPVCRPVPSGCAPAGRPACGR